MRRIAGRAALLAAAVALVLGAPVVALLLPRGAVASVVPDSQCNAPFPVKLFPTEHTEPRVRQMVVCSNRAGTATLLINRTHAVWVVTQPADAPLYRLQTSISNQSFMDLIGPQRRAIPSGSAVVSLGPPTATRIRVDAQLTLAQLTHDQLVSSLGSVERLARAALDPEPSSARRALRSCLQAVLEQIDDPRLALRSEDPTNDLAGAAGRAAAGSSSPCVRDWLEAQIDAGVPSVDVTPFAYDAFGWATDGLFGRYADSAGETYRGVSAGADAVAAR